MSTCQSSMGVPLQNAPGRGRFILVVVGLEESGKPAADSPGGVHRYPRSVNLFVVDGLKHGIGRHGLCPRLFQWAADQRMQWRQWRPIGVRRGWTVVCSRGNFVGKELHRLFYLQSRCLQPGMDHADDWCDATRDAQSHTLATNSDARSDAPDASDSHSAATHWWLRAREGL